MFHQFLVELKYAKCQKCSNEEYLHGSKGSAHDWNVFYYLIAGYCHQVKIHIIEAYWYVDLI